MQETINANQKSILESDKCRKLICYRHIHYIPCYIPQSLKFNLQNKSPLHSKGPLLTLLSIIYRRFNNVLCNYYYIPLIVPQNLKFFSETRFFRLCFQKLSSLYNSVSFKKNKAGRKNFKKHPACRGMKK